MIFIEIDHNTIPCVPGCGSAVFLHLGTGEFRADRRCVLHDASRCLRCNAGHRPVVSDKYDPRWLARCRKTALPQPGNTRNRFVDRSR